MGGIIACEPIYNAHMLTTFPTPRLEFAKPLINAAGSLGFTPDSYGPISTETLGAFVTNPISSRARQAANLPCLKRFPGGVLLHTGHPNPGLSRTIKTYSASWARALVPIIVHLLSTKADELRKAVLRLEELENVVAIEIGFVADSSIELVSELIKSGAGELSIIAQLPLTRALDLSSAAMEAGASVISLGPPRGSLVGPNGKLVSGRMYGPAIFPLALETVRQISEMDIPIIGAGGVGSEEQANSMLAAGAMAVQMDVGLWKGITNNE